MLTFMRVKHFFINLIFKGSHLQQIRNFFKVHWPHTLKLIMNPTLNQCLFLSQALLVVPQSSSRLTQGPLTLNLWFLSLLFLINVVKRKRRCQGYRTSYSLRRKVKGEKQGDSLTIVRRKKVYIYLPIQYLTNISSIFNNQHY